jgi:hypothetical protein
MIELFWTPCGRRGLRARCDGRRHDLLSDRPTLESFAPYPKARDMFLGFGWFRELALWHCPDCLGVVDAPPPWTSIVAPWSIDQAAIVEPWTGGLERELELREERARRVAGAESEATQSTYRPFEPRSTTAKRRAASTRAKSVVERAAGNHCARCGASLVDKVYCWAWTATGDRVAVGSTCAGHIRDAGDRGELALYCDQGDRLFSRPRKGPSHAVDT